MCLSVETTIQSVHVPEGGSSIPRNYRRLFVERGLEGDFSEGQEVEIAE